MRFLFIILLLLSAPAFAQSKETLKQIQSQVEAEQAKQEAIDAKMKNLDKDMKGLKTNLIETTDKVQKSEQEAGKLEDKLDDLSARKKDLTNNLEKDRQSLADLITALERIRRVPPEALIARPGAPLETAKASVVLGAIMPELNKRAEAFRTKLDELQNVEEDLSANKQKLKATAEKLKASKEKMERLMADRKDALDQAKSEFDEQEEQVAALSKKASDLKDLIAKIESERAKRKKRSSEPVEGKKRRNKVDEEKLGGTLAALGNARPPVAGTIAIKYGQPDNLGADSEGVHIKSRPGSVVVAPMKGVVRYAGPFKSYGSIVLIEHKNNYHSLIAGLGRIDTVVGQSVDAGEPLGTLGSTPSLYYELRYNGQPINPARKFASLG